MKLFRKAIVIIHGFTGNLYDNEYLMNYLELNPLYDVYAETLPGHNQDRFCDATIKEWKQSVDDLINRLVKNGYHSIYVVGHSMGGILACYIAGRHKEIKKLVLVNAAFDYLNFKQNKSDFKNKDFSKYNHLFQKVIRVSPLILNEFRKLVKESGNFLKNVNCETLILRSLKDEIIPYEVGDTIYNKISSKEKSLTDISNASHVVLSGQKKEIVSEYIGLFFKGGIRWKKNIKKEI